MNSVGKLTLKVQLTKKNVKLIHGNLAKPN